MRRATLGRIVHSLPTYLVACLAAWLYAAPAAAIAVTAISYDPATDQLVMTIAYRGTNPDHEFTVQWDECRRLGTERMEILGLLIDSQPNDLARQEFTKPLRIDLKDFSCRPATVTIRTSAGFFASVNIPQSPRTHGPSAPPGPEPRNAP